MSENMEQAKADLDVAEGAAAAAVDLGKAAVLSTGAAADDVAKAAEEVKAHPAHAILDEIDTLSGKVVAYSEIGHSAFVQNRLRELVAKARETL